MSNDSSNAVKEAYKDQGVKNTTYGYTDSWKGDKLEKKELIAQIEYRKDDYLNDKDTKSQAVSQYFIKAKELEDFRDKETGLIDARKLTEAVQVAPRYDNDVGKAVYNPKVSIYEVQSEIKVATSKVENNITLGDGGAQQYRTELSVRDLDKGGYLKRVEVEKTINNDHQLPVFKKIEKEVNERGLRGSKDEQIEARNEFIGKSVYTAQSLKMEVAEASGSKPAIDRVNEIKKHHNISHAERGEPLPHKQKAVGKTSPAKESKAKSAGIER